MCKWFKDFFKIEIPELDYHVQFFTKHGGWTAFTYDDTKRYYYGEIAEPESFEGYDKYYIRWIDDAPENKKLIEIWIYKQYKKEWQ
jgi:hypothetical protein